MTPVLWSFRRCPYAMRARLAIVASGVSVALREIALRDKPAAFLADSPSSTVPCLVTIAGEVIDESLDIMRWALAQHDPAKWLDMPVDGDDWIARCDGPFKHALDRVKYASRYPDTDPALHLATACAFCGDLDAKIDGWIFTRPTLADMAILPLLRQFAMIDKPWFNAQPWPHLQDWLERFLASSELAAIMAKYALWRPDQPEINFP
ncbi:MAG: glutathione S-transferase [Rhodobacteraceae bacterium]|nr:MAG: glutathione S-transferase [Paracoccaceae bacterium]